MKTFFRILNYARPLGIYIPQYLLYVVLTTIFSVINFTILVPLLEVLFNQVGQEKLVTSMPEFAFTIGYFRQVFYYYLSNFIIQEGKLSALYFICGSVVVSVFLSNLFRFLAAVILVRVRVNVVKNLRNHAFECISRFDLAYFTSKRKGDIVSRVTTDVLEVEQSVVSTLRVLVKEPFLIIGYFIALFTMSVELTLYTLILIPLAGTTISLLVKRLKQSAKLSQENQGRINATLDEVLSGMRIVKAFGAGGYVRKKFAVDVEDYARSTYRLSSRANLASPISEFFGVSVVALLLIIGGRMVLSGESALNAAEFIGFLILFSQVLNPAKAMSNAFSSISRGIASGERIFQLMDTSSDIVDNKHARSISDIHECIELKNVSFAYEQQPVLKDIHLIINKGELVALVGPSGAGKSTIADLIPRFYDPQRGEVLLDGVPLHHYKLDELRALMGIVSQETILFHDTVANNIAFGKPDATRDEIEAAAKVANAHEFIERLDDGYDTYIGERGTKLSGGQRQRLNIARAVFKNPPILILDEATSSLDAKSEQLVQQALYNVMKERTCLVIAHRLSTVLHADKIVVMQEGQVIQQGTHEELSATDGLYKQMTQMQSF